MNYKIAILGSTGSIGRSLIKILSKQKRNQRILLLTADKNYKLILKQATQYNVKNIIITNKKYFNIAKSINKQKKINIYNNFENLNKIFKNKIDYVMNAIVGLHGLIPTFKIIKHTKKIAIANKETIICAWNLIQKELKNHDTEFVPVDSEHFSIWYALKNNTESNIEKLYLTASGGPLLDVPLSNFKNLTVSKIINHPNWNMGPKISVDSSTIMNKVFEVIEAKKLFNLNYKQISILIHPKSYVHAILKFSDGMIKIVAHDTTMEIPISNTLNFIKKNKFRSSQINFNKLNNLQLSNVDENKFKCVKLLKNLPNKDSLFETVLVTTNDQLVKLFLEKKITYLELIKNLLKILSKKEFIKYKLIEPKTITDILNLNKTIKLKINQSVKIN